MTKKCFNISEGVIFGRLTIVRDLHPDKYNSDAKKRYLCRCSCGDEYTTSYRNLKANTKYEQSCGCAFSEKIKERLTTHGDSIGKVTYLYQLWQNIKSKCNNPTNKVYPGYGGRGIQFKDEWCSNFVSFRDWILNNLGERPLGQSLDRINNDGNYEPGNLRWANRKTQSNNKRNTIAIVQKTLLGDYIASYPSISLAHDAIGKPKSSNINTCLKGITKTAYGFIWERAEKLCP